MTTVTILIEKTDIAGTQALFAPGVKPGGTVRFRSSAPELEVVFPNDLLFEAPGLLTATSTVRTIPVNATPGIYSFHIVRQGDTDPVTYLQLAVESDGIDNVGFFLEEEAGRLEVRTEQRVSAGALTIRIEKQVINQEAWVSVWQQSENLIPPTKIAAGTASLEVMNLMLTGILSVRLEDRPLPIGFDGQSGGTGVIDIIAEPG